MSVETPVQCSLPPAPPSISVSSVSAATLIALPPSPSSSIVLPSSTSDPNINSTHLSLALKSSSEPHLPIYGFLPFFENLEYPVLFDRIDKRNLNEKKSELYAENELIGLAITQAAAAHPEEWYNAEIQQPKKTEVFYAIEDIFLPCTEKKCNKEIAHVQMHQPYKKGGRSDDNIAAHIVTGAVIEVVPSPKTPNIARYNFVNMISDTVTPKVHFVAVPLLGTLDNICTFDFSASQKVSPTQIVQVWWNYNLAVQLAGISEFNKLYRSLASVAAVRKAASEPAPPPDPFLGPQSRLTTVNQYRFLHSPVESRTHVCEAYLEASLRSDIALEDRNSRAMHANANAGANAGAGNVILEKEKEYERRMEILRARYIGYGESRALHTQSQILERKKKRKDKMENERVEREKEKEKQHIIVEDEVTPKRKRVEKGGETNGFNNNNNNANGNSNTNGNNNINQLSTSITKLVKPEMEPSPSSPPSPPSSSPLSSPLSSPTITPSSSIPSLSSSVSSTASNLVPTSTSSTAVILPSFSKDIVMKDNNNRGNNSDDAVLFVSNDKDGRNRERETIKLAVELEYLKKKLEKKKTTQNKQKSDMENLKMENEKLREANRAMENKMNNFMEKYEQLKEKYQKAKDTKHKFHELEIEYVMLKTKEEMNNKKDHP